MRSGIYQIANQVNDKRYIGSTVNLRKRWREHLRRLQRGRHGNPHLQAAFDKYGEKAFVFSVLDQVDSERLIEREQQFLDTLSPEYNISPTAGSSLGVRHTEATKRKMSEAHKGRTFSEDHRRKLSEAQRGKCGNNYGKQASAETRRKIGDAHRGKPLSAEHRHRISRALMGRRREPFSEDWRAKLGGGEQGPEAYCRDARENEHGLDSRTQASTK